MKKTKRIIAILLTICIAASITACSSSKSPQSSNSSVVNVTSGEIKTKVMESYEHPAYQELTPEQVKEMYYIDPAILENYSVNIPMMNVNASEIAVFKVKDTSNIKAVEEGIGKRAADLDEVWKRYLPAQYELVKNHKIKVNGNYVMFVVHQDADKIIATFDEMVAKK